jgi:hypothetical protein
MKTLKFGEIANAVKILKIAAEESRGYLAKTTQSELNNGLEVLMELLTNEVEQSEGNGEISDIDAENFDFELDQISNLLKK